MGNSLWLSRGACTLVAALGAVSAAALPAGALVSSASAQADGHPSRPASPSPSRPAPEASQASEWWLNALSAQQEWSAAPQEGSGITVAVLSSGVDASQPDLTGNVAPGPDFTGSGRSQGGPYWGAEGTAVASLIAGHGHGDGSQGITGVAPKARILSVRVTLDPKDPQLGQAGTVQRLPGAIANGINYAVSHGAQVIDLPADPATIALGKGGESGGSPAEEAAVRNASAHNVVLVAPAGDTGTARDTSYPAAYPGVVAAGATGQNGQLASFSATGSYVSLTAPGKGLTVAKPGSGYTMLSSTDASAALTSGIAALIRSRYPQLSATQVTKALKSSAEAVSGHQPGTGAGAITATNAVTSAASVVSLIGTSTPKLVSRLPEEAAIGAGIIVVLGLIIFGIVRFRRRDPDADIPDWGDGLSDARPAGEDDPASQEDPASQRGPGSPGRRASAADAVGRAASARLPQDSGSLPRSWNQVRTNPDEDQFWNMPTQGSSPMQAADSPLPRRQSRKQAHQPGAHRR